MAPPQEKLATSLEALKKLQARGVVAIRARDLKRADRERLLKNGFIEDVMKGWYVPARPDRATGESTAWYASFWAFCAGYLNERFGDAWCLSPAHSLSLHAGSYTVPRQLLVRSPKGGNKITELPYGTSLFDVRARMPNDKDIVIRDGLRLYALPAALVACNAGFFANRPTDARAALLAVGDASDILSHLLDGGHSTLAGRLAGAFRNIARDRIADDIVRAMEAAGYTIRENDPFATRVEFTLSRRDRSPYAGRIRLMWQQMRGPVIDRFPIPPGPISSSPGPQGTANGMDAYLKRVNDSYVADAYHSLSIEGYRVTPALIERVRSGNWNPDLNEHDREQRHALAARGYWQAFRAVRRSLGRVLRSEDPGRVADEDHGTWYRELFAPGVTAGLLKPGDLAGYRGGPVHIRRSMHIPPPAAQVRDAMPVLFELLAEESTPSVRVVLGHFIFVHIHPYTDGNGRIGRFLMNVMLAAGGYPWTVIPVERRARYMAALEDASVRQDIAPFVDFLAVLVESGLRGEPMAAVPGTAAPG